MPTSRIPQPALERFGLFTVVESKRTVLPLKGVECDFSVLSGIAEVSITQIFRQENDRPMDCEYLFPLPADASVYCCEADINGRTIRAQVREREEARELAAQKKAAGYRTALVESERDNLFTLSLGNVQPGDFVVIQLKYFQTLRSLARMPSIEIPFCPGVRYIPGKPLLRSNLGKGTIDDTDQVPDASKITPVRIDADHPDAAFIDVRGTLDGKFVDEKTLASPSHPIVVERTGEELRIALSDRGDVPDRDFVLRWSEKDVDAVAPRVWIRQKGTETFALLEVRAPQITPVERPPVDFYFLVDRSGSMEGEKWDKAAKALQSCVRVLGPADRAMITFFESEFRDFAERPLHARELIGDKQFQRVKKLGTTGGTELRSALKHVLEVAARHSADRVRNLILITDAQIGNESAVLELMQTAPDLPVHCFGIDAALNDSLLLALTRQQGGTFHSLNPNDDIEGAVTALGETLGHPVLLDLSLSSGWEIAEARIPNLYAGQIHYLSARSSNGAPLELFARNPSSEKVKIQFQPQTSTLDAPWLHWCRSRIQKLVAEGNEQAAVALSVESNLICQLTAFVAWDESEKVAVASHHLVQPCMLGEITYGYTDPGAAVGAKRSSGYSLCTGFAGTGDDDDTTLLLRKTPTLDILKLKRKLSDLCHRAGVADWEQLVKAIFDWIVQAEGHERSDRIQTLSRLLEKLAQNERDEVQVVLKAFVGTLTTKRP